jgi:hypothetical protein
MFLEPAQDFQARQFLALRGRGGGRHAFFQKT